MNALTEAEKIDQVWARITLGLWIAAVVLVGQGFIKYLNSQGFWAIAADAAPSPLGKPEPPTASRLFGRVSTIAFSASTDASPTPASASSLAAPVEGAGNREKRHGR